MKKHALRVIRTLGARDVCRNGREVSGVVLVEVATLKCGSHYTSKYETPFYIYIDTLLFFRSEGPAQVFLLILAWLVAAFKNRKREDYKDITLCYDNMCHLDNLTVAKKPLLLPGDLQHIWLDITKCIDSLHLKNHKDPRCAMLYSPDHLNGDNNTMSCEQTFAWLSRYKKFSIISIYTV